LKSDKLQFIKLYSLILSSFFVLQGCVSLFGIKPDPVVVEAPPPKEKPVRFSDNPNLGVFNANKYRHMTKNQLEDESEVHARAGSLWNNEGQSAYLFSQNTIRREGELLKVKLDGAARSQVETKVSVIKKLLARVEAPLPTLNPMSPDTTNPNSPNNPITGGLASNQNPSANPSPNSAAANPQAIPAPAANAPARTPASEGPGSVKSVGLNQNKNEDAGSEFNVENIPTRIVERLADGNYRVKGSQTFMIGKREFKVIAMGLVRPDDFNEEGISAGKLLDPQFDVVSLRRNQQ
jgi:flagellar L-ring protein precursor FlgH